jgi:hypothetical protein
MSSIHYFVLAGLAGIVLVGVCFWRIDGRASRQLANGFQEAFERAFAELRPMPKLEVLHWVYPQFLVTFESESQRSLAMSEGRTEAFSAAIQTLCARQRRWGASFRAELAIHYGYEGQFDAQFAKWAAEDALRKRLFKQ